MGVARLGAQGGAGCGWVEGGVASLLSDEEIDLSKSLSKASQAHYFDGPSGGPAQKPSKIIGQITQSIKILSGSNSSKLENQLFCLIVFWMFFAV